jgi:hypothetical protein
MQRRRRVSHEDQMMAWLKQFDGRKPVSAYPADELERLIVRDAVMGFEARPDGEPFLWWALQGYLRLSHLRRMSKDAVFESIAARVSVETGRVWP